MGAIFGKKSVHCSAIEEKRKRKGFCRNFNEPKFENDTKNQKLLDIYSEVTSNGWNTILEDELKTESEYNCMVYFRV